MPAPAVSNPPFHFDSWNRNQGMCRAQGLSLAAHSLVAVILLIPVVHPILGPSLEHREASVSSTVFFPPYRHALPAGKKPAHGGGSGGNEDLTPATKGKLAPFSWLQITPPAMPHTPDTKLAAVGTVLGPPEIRLPEERLRNYGLPDASAVTDSAGPGHNAGFGNRCCGGMGLEGDGRGAGRGKNWGIGGEGEPGGWAIGTSMPECIYCPNPAFSDEARKSKTQGVVVLRLVVMPDGRAANISVVKGVGVGLDERAVEVVQTWRFRPAKEPGGKVVPIWITVEVTFRLL